MRHSKGLVARFQKHYFEKFGENISSADAEAELVELAELIRLTVRPANQDTKVREEDEPNTK